MRACRQPAQHSAMFCFAQSLISRLRRQLPPREAYEVPVPPTHFASGRAQTDTESVKKTLKRYRDVFRFRSRNRRCSADEEKLRETHRVSYSSPLAQGSLAFATCRMLFYNRACYDQNRPPDSRRAVFSLFLFRCQRAAGVAEFAVLNVQRHRQRGKVGLVRAVRVHGSKN